MKIFVTGGAGYIGSHVVRTLGEKGHELLTYDNLSSGNRDAVLHGTLVVGDLADRACLDEALEKFRPDAVMHFASFIQVGESVLNPLKYYINNTSNSIQLIDAAAEHGVKYFVFSSSAAVYGQPESVPISEENPVTPINPYGFSKAFIERVLSDMSRAGDFRAVSLRYFNAAGAEPRARIGECHDPETHLIPLALKTAKKERKNLTVFGTDYPTPDGTCLRDYIHVDDLAEAHVMACEYLAKGGRSDVFNCGYGHGYSVREVIAATKRVTGVDFPIVHSGRREGDPPALVAQSDKIRAVLGWKPEFDDLDYIIRTAWEWERGKKFRR